MYLKSSNLAASEWLCLCWAFPWSSGIPRADKKPTCCPPIPHPLPDPRSFSSNLLPKWRSSATFNSTWIQKSSSYEEDFGGHFTILRSLGEFQNPADQNLDDPPPVSYSAFCTDERQGTTEDQARHCWHYRTFLCPSNLNTLYSTKSWIPG